MVAVPIFLWYTLQDLGPGLRKVVQGRRVVGTHDSVASVALQVLDVNARSQGPCCLQYRCLANTLIESPRRKQGFVRLK